MNEWHQTSTIHWLRESVDRCKSITAVGKLIPTWGQLVRIAPCKQDCFIHRCQETLQTTARPNHYRLPDGTLQHRNDRIHLQWSAPNHLQVGHRHIFETWLKHAANIATKCYNPKHQAHWLYDSHDTPSKWESKVDSAAFDAHLSNCVQCKLSARRLDLGPNALAQPALCSVQDHKKYTSHTRQKLQS